MVGPSQEVPEPASEAPLFSPIEDRRVFREVLVQLEEAIVDGRLAAGDRLPSERELVQQFGVSRTSVREALRVLEALGVVRVRPGPDHGATLVAGPVNTFRDFLQFQLALRHISIASLVEFRLVIESWAASTAAMRASDHNLMALERTVADMRGTLEPIDFLTLDASFHLEVARLSGNELLVLVLEGARNAIERVMREAVTAAGDWPSMRDRLVREHEEILEAIIAREGSRAASLVARHIEVLYTQTLMPAAEGDSGSQVKTAPAAPLLSDAKLQAER